MKRVLILIVILLCMCLCLSSCGEDTGTNEEVIEGYSEKTVLRYSDPYDGLESELQALFSDGDRVYCAVTDRKSAETVRYLLSGGTIKMITSVSWVQTKIGAYDNQSGGHSPLVEDAELVNERNQGFVFLPDGEFAVVGHEQDNRILTVYADTATKTVGVDGYGLPLYKARITIGKAEKENTRFETVLVDDHSVVLFPVHPDSADASNAILVDLDKGSSSAAAIGAELLENGVCKEGILYCCVDGELKAIDIRSAEPDGEFEPFRLSKSGEEEDVRILDVSGDDLLWTDTNGVHIFSLSERKNSLLKLPSSEYKTEAGWNLQNACIDGRGDIYIHYERSTESSKETALVCYSNAPTQDVELMTLKVAGTIFDSNYCDEKGIRLTEIISDRFQPEELRHEEYDYFIDFYQLHLHADYDDPVLRPDCTIQGCDHRSPACEAWGLESKGYPYEFHLGDSVLRVTQFRGDLNQSENSDPRFPSGTGILIEKNDSGGQTDYQIVIPDALLSDGKLYFDGENLVFKTYQNGAVVNVFDTQTGTITKQIRTELSDVFHVSEKKQIILADLASQKGVIIDTDTWQCGVVTGIRGQAEWYNYDFDGCSYVAGPMYDFELLDNLPNPYGLEYSQVFRKYGDKGLVRFSSEYQDETAIVDLVSGEVLSGTVPMKNIWGEDIPNIYLESEKYYIFSPGVVWNSPSFPAPPDYFDGMLDRRTYRGIYAFIEKEAFWDGETNYTVFEMPS